jgi:hypothetical protein
MFLYKHFVPIYTFEYFDDNKEKHVFEAVYPYDYDFETVKSPCGNYNARKIPSLGGTVKTGLQHKEKKAGVTNKRKEVGNFMKEQRRKRKSTYEPGTREYDSNELWTGQEGKDGVTECPVEDRKKGNK